MKFTDITKKKPDSMLLCLFQLQCEQFYVGVHSDDITHSMKYIDFARGYYDKEKNIFKESSAVNAWNDHNNDNLEVDSYLLKVKVVKWVSIQDLQSRF